MKNFHTICDITFLLFIVFPGKFNSPQVKPTLNSSITNFIYELPNDLRLRSWKSNKGRIKRKIGWSHWQVTSLPSKN